MSWSRSVSRRDFLGFTIAGLTSLRPSEIAWPQHWDQGVLTRLVLDPDLGRTAKLIVCGGVKDEFMMNPNSVYQIHEDKLVWLFTRSSWPIKNPGFPKRGDLSPIVQPTYISRAVLMIQGERSARFSMNSPIGVFDGDEVNITYTLAFDPRVVGCLRRS